MATTTWLSILEASFIIFKLPPYFENFGKRTIKSPKYYFIDTGLLAFILGIEQPNQVTRDPLVGQIFENLVIAECLKARLNTAAPANLYFYRDYSGREIDLIIQQGRELKAVEIKSSHTFSLKFFENIDKVMAYASAFKRSDLIYNGEDKSLSPVRRALNFRQAARAART
jgi:predicted AAA+ superfamily ATPase